MIGTSPLTTSATGRNAVIAAGVPSSARPPWLDTWMAAAPAEIAARASSGRVMPLTITGRPVTFRIISTSFQPRSVLKGGWLASGKLP